LAIETCDRKQETESSDRIITQCKYSRIIGETAITYTETKRMRLRTCTDCLIKLRCTFLSNNIIYINKMGARGDAVG